MAGAAIRLGSIAVGLLHACLPLLALLLCTVAQAQGSGGSPTDGQPAPAQQQRADAATSAAPPATDEGSAPDARADGSAEELPAPGRIVPYRGEIVVPYAAREAGPPTARRDLPAGVAPGDQAPSSRAAPVMRLDELPERQPGVVIKIILGLLAVMALAWLAGQRRVQRWEQRLGVAQLVTTGLPFIALGLVGRLPAVGLLTDAILVELSPLLHLGLGWIGFTIGFRFDARLLDTLPPGTAPKVGFSTGIPFLAVVATVGLLFLSTSGWQVSLRDPVFLRDAMILGSAGAITARSAARIAGGGGGHEGLMLQIIRLEELAGVAGLTIVAAYFRPEEAVAWQLPGTAWIFITLGLGATVGLVGYGILRRPATQAESLVLLLGTVAFAAGLASNLLISPVVVCFVAGVLLVNFPGDYKERVTTTLKQLERPIYLLFLVVVGAIWSVGDWRGWALMGVFLIARFLGSLAGVKLGWSEGELALTRDERLVLAAAPMGQLSIAIVINALLLYPQGTVPLLVTAVIGGAVITEVAVQLLVRQLRRVAGREQA